MIAGVAGVVVVGAALGVRYLLRERPGCDDAVTVGASAGGLILAGAVLSQNPWRSVDGYAGHSAGVQLLGADLGIAALARVGSIGGVPQLNTVARSHRHRRPRRDADARTRLRAVPEINSNHPEVWGDEAKREADAIDRLNELKSRGVDSIVDLTVIGLGRYIPRIARIAAATDVNIVVATGIYTYNDVPMYFHFRGPGHAARTARRLMTDMFVRDITEGIAGTGVKAAILKCATDEPGVTPGVERVLRAVAQAHRQTGVPISTHTHAATRRGLEQQRIFAEEGVDLSRVVIGHSGDTTDLDYLEELIAQGSYIGMDRFGVDVLPADRGTRRHRGADVRARSRRQDGAVPRRVVLHRLAAGGTRARRDAELALPPHLTTTCCRRSRARRHRGADHHDAGGQPAQDLRAPRAGTEVAGRTPPIGTQVSRWPG